MKHPFSHLLRWYRNLRALRAQKRRNRAAQQTLRLWSWLEKLFESGQLTFDYDHHRLFITQPLAALMLQNGADGWIRSVHNIYQYVHFLQTQRAWEQYMQREELAAVRAAMKRPSPDPIPADAPTRSLSLGERGVDTTEPQDNSRPSAAAVPEASASGLSRSDIDRIRLARRQEIALSDMEPPRVEPFEFFVIPLSTESHVDPIAVGYYDPDTGQMDVAPWSDVAVLLHPQA